MAGGSGERFWPVSRKSRPKQLLKLSSETMTMVEESIDRISPLIPPEDVFIITGAHLLEPIRAALPLLPPENVVAEPAKRNTAPCLALSAAFIKERYAGQYKPGEISIAVLTADQSIPDKDAFLKTVEAALDYVENNPVLSTIGIKPDRPETGYGYIEVAEPFPNGSSSAEIKSVVRFREKPDFETAKEFVAAGNYLWNSGMFFWRLDTFAGALAKCLPELGGKIDFMAGEYSGKTYDAKAGALDEIADTFAAFPNTSIDYGLMEKADNVVVTRALFTWDDIGSWDSLPRIRPTDADGNVNSGRNVIFDMKDSVIYNEGKEMIVGAFGLEDVVIVASDDAVLVCPKERVQEVKKIVGEIRSEHGEKWL